MSGLPETGRVLIVAGVALIALGLVLVLAERVPGVGHLPGDFVIRRGGFTLYLPLASCLLLSVVLSLFWSLLRR